MAIGDRVKPADKAAARSRGRVAGVVKTAARFLPVEVAADLAFLLEQVAKAPEDQDWDAIDRVRAKYGWKL